MQFIIEILIWVLIFFTLRKYWHLKKVQKHFIDFVIALNGLACIMYGYNIYLGTLSPPDGMSKIFLHGIVAIIVYTLTRDTTYKSKDE